MKKQIWTKLKERRLTTLCLVIMAAFFSLTFAKPPAVKAETAVFNPQAISWSQCPPSSNRFFTTEMDCGMLQVPVDYQNPDGRKMLIAVSRIKSADQSSKQGILLSNPGGPGGSGLEMPRLLAALLPEEVRARYDLIGFDPRGIGDSSPITCGLTETQTYQAFPPLAQSAGFDATKKFMEKVANSCEQKAGPTLAHITTANTARDMDTIRRALSEPKLSYLGYSYGTQLGAVYASLFSSKLTV